MILVTVQVRAELAGNVWKVLVKEGQQVAAEETIVILESMKMEIPVAAPQAGTVKRIMVRAGQAVQEGDPLVEVG
jgi:acetyl-CoA carboxylase biotin carboxyl carrier protein